MHNPLKYLVIFMVFFYSSFSQNETKNNYLLMECHEFTDSSRFIINSLKGYDSYFIGERHTMKKVEFVTNQLIDIINFNDPIDYLYLEMPYSEYVWYKFLNNLDGDENLIENYIKIVSRCYYYENTVKKILKSNKEKKSDTKIFPIDECEKNDFSKISLSLLLNEDSVKIIPELKKDYKLLFGRTLKSKKKFILVFKKLFDSYQEIYKRLLGSDFFIFERIVNNFYENINNKNLSHELKDINREEFMYQSFGQKNDTTNFLCLTGKFHIPIEKVDGWLNNNNFESMAFRLKERNQLKVCSIYLMNTEFDRMDNYYFMETKNFLRNNLKEGKTYLIRVDKEDCPFDDVKNKFTFILFKNASSF